MLAVAALLARAAETSTSVCLALLKGGVRQLVRLVRARRTDDLHHPAEWGTRLQAADLLRFSLARVRLSVHKPEEAALLVRSPAASASAASEPTTAMRTHGRPLLPPSPAPVPTLLPASYPPESRPRTHPNPGPVHTLLSASYPPYSRPDPTFLRSSFPG